MPCTEPPACTPCLGHQSASLALQEQPLPRHRLRHTGRDGVAPEVGQERMLEEGTEQGRLELWERPGAGAARPRPGARRRGSRALGADGGASKGRGDTAGLSAQLHSPQ